MKNLTLAFLIFGFLFFGCNQPNSKSIFAKDDKSSDKTEASSGNPNITLEAEEMLSATIDSQSYQQEKLEGYKEDSIKKLIELFKIGDIDNISNKILFPLDRSYPIPSIKNKEEFKQRFSEVFDTILIDIIVNSKIEQWSEVGWRGIMLDRGTLWMGNSDGVITAVNYQSDFEKKLKQDLIAKSKQNLHVSLKTFERPIHKVETESYLIRIDELANEKYRYAAWSMGEKESSKPDIILADGVRVFDGSGGNHSYSFIDGNYTYTIHRHILATRYSPDVSLVIEKDGEIIIKEDGSLLP